MQKIGILGSTGTIGKKALGLAKGEASDFELIFITCHNNISLLRKQKALYQPKYAIVTGTIDNKLNDDFLHGWESVLKIIKDVEIDFLFVASSGVDCISVIYEAIKKGIKIATANKETIVVAGDILCELARNRNVLLIPVDSEHSGIFQCLMGHNIKNIRKVTLTASGGPFLYRNIQDLDNITVKEALQHPIWPMGNKITIDSATMMNKALELIEAHYLFNIPTPKLDTIIHPQSIIHAIVSFNDGSSIAQLSIPDMTIPISFALHYPERKDMANFTLDLTKEKDLTFMEMDYKRFPFVKMVKELLESRFNSYIITVEVANEISVKAFLENKIKFKAIETVIKNMLDTTKPLKLCSINDILLYRKEIALKTINLIRGM